MKIAVSQLNPIIGYFEYNRSLIIEAYEKARSVGCSLIVFPELCLSGYPPKDLLEKQAFIKDNLDCLKDLSHDLKEIFGLIGYIDKNPANRGKSLFNMVALLKDGKVLGRGGKRLLPTYDVFDETRYFEPAPESLLFELEGKKIGVTICEDIWNVGDLEGIPRYEHEPVAELLSRGMDILINISASPYTVHKPALRTRILKSISKGFNIPVLYCNQVGGNDDLIFDGSSMVMDAQGRLIMLGKEFESDLIIWDSERKYTEIIEQWPREEESVLRGLVMGTRDYVTKCGFSKVLIGLSGGIDSSLVAVIAKMAMGPENVMAVSMPSPYTSDMSKEDSAKLAKNLGIGFREIPIDEMIKSYGKALNPVFENLERDETEENIQARIRGNILMAISNKLGYLLLSTGNKSETATGYCTLYGDMSGALAVISDIPKTLCYRLARYINKEREWIPERIITRPPSAELRPDQKDQDTLPPYDLLDEVVEMIIEKNLSLEDIVDLGYERETVEGIFKRIIYNEYKRRQAPPGLKITSKAFGYGRRYPIARGGGYY